MGEGSAEISNYNAGDPGEESADRRAFDAIVASTEACPGCGAVFEKQDGPTHRYMISTAGCWRHFGEHLAAEYADPTLLPIHRLSVDTYAVQHPGDGSRRAIQSVGLHLARLMIQLEAPTPPAETNDVMLRLGRRKATLRRLERPERFAMTIADVARFSGTSRHVEVVRAWAESTWNDWRQHHDYIRAWAGRA